jgi:hypothetical protein
MTFNQTKPLKILVLLIFGATTILPGQASADRHCSIGLGIISIALADLTTAKHLSTDFTEMLGDITADFEACGCTPAIELINTISDDNLNTPEQLYKKLSHIFTTAKQYCEY